LIEPAMYTSKSSDKRSRVRLHKLTKCKIKIEK